MTPLGFSPVWRQCDAPAVIKAAAVVEFIHLASLHHDDVMGQTHVRRGVPTVNAPWGNRIAVRSGDFLLARAAQLTAQLGAEVIRAQRSALSRLVQGQALEVQGPRPGEDLLTHYLKVVDDKTGSLIALAGRTGAMAAGAQPDIVEAFDTFGETLGRVFQLADDLLDISGDPASSGKEAGTDLRQGVDTLPVLLCAQCPPIPMTPPTRLPTDQARPGDARAHCGARCRRDVRQGRCGHNA
ncbi:polyprenyl synthetase family protein [Streptomyces sp. NPDC088733]|uniref:polyprenyl synthetase family protein n=1 Tax=Streptomyces sp. NPDC088733 TaxID=3365880 RepID=UPI00382F003A